MKIKLQKTGDGDYIVETGWWFFKQRYQIPNYELSRLLTNTQLESRSGIFSDGELMFERHDRNGQTVRKVLITLPTYNWRYHDICEVAAEIKNRARIVKEAFEQFETKEIDFEV